MPDSFALRLQYIIVWSLFLAGLAPGFEVEAAAPADLAKPAATVAEIPVAPRPMPERITLSQDSIFGFSSHMIHTDKFFPQYGPYWRIEYILPLIVGGHFGVVREALYQGKFADDRRTPPTKPEDQAKEATRAALRPGNRGVVEDYLGRYTHAGVRTVLCSMFTLSDRPGFTDYFNWVGDLAKKFPLQAVEMHNEPNLKHFWGGTPHDYAEACKAGARIIKQHSPKTPVVIGSISHLWWGPGIEFLKAVLKEGTLDSADGISVHPYRMKSAPEGGAMREPASSPDGFERELRAFWGMIQGYNNANRPLGLYLTEYGYSSGTKGGLVVGQSEGAANTERQADYLSRSMLLFFDVRLRGLPIEGVYWYDLKCDGKDSINLEHNFGVVSFDTTELRPGYKAYSAIAQAFEHTSDWEAINLPASSDIQPASVKGFSWHRLSDGALALSFWRLNQLQERDEDFQAKISWPLPEGFVPGRAVLHELHTDKISEIPVTVAGGRITVDLNVTARAAWIEIFPEQLQAVRWAGRWSSTLPAEFSAPNGARIRLDAPRRISPGTAADVSVTVNNRSGRTAFAGSLHWLGQNMPLAAEAGQEKSQVLKATSATGNEPQVGWYLVITNDTVIGRGGYTIPVEQTSLKPPK